MEIGLLFTIIKIKKTKTTDNQDLNTLKNNHLSIQFSLDGFSFCILNKNSNTFTKLHEYEFSYTNSKTPQALITKIAEVFDKNELLTQKYDSVSVNHVNDLATFVPKPLFQEEKLATYVEYNNKIFKNDYFVYDELPHHQIINVFAPYVNINNFFIDFYKGFEYKHISYVLVNTILNTYKQGLNTNSMFINVNANHFEMIVIKNKKFHLYNTFKYQTKEDFIYYILFTAEQLKLDVEKFNLQLFGAIDKDDVLYKIAHKYIRNVALLHTMSKYKFDDSFTEKVKRKHFALLNQY